MNKLTYIIIILLVSVGSCFASGQDITATERSEIIDKVVDQLANKYVDPNVGKKAANAIEQKKKQHAYDSLDQKAKLIQALIADMHETTNDKHLQLVDPNGFGQGFRKGPGKMRSNIQVFNPNATSQSQMKQNKLIQEMFKRMNYGLDPNVLDGNIGYLAIHSFESPVMAPDVFKAIDRAMKTIQDCSAIIIDVRRCSRGGFPDTMMYIVSYFFSREKSVLLYEVYDREQKKINEYRTKTDVPGKCLPNVPLYILVSPKTFSAGEAFAYGFQKIGRAKVVGETTAGAAHGTDTVPIGHGIMMVVPVNRLAHARTKSNWQGTGVIPDIPSNEDDALSVAIELIKKR